MQRNDRDDLELCQPKSIHQHQNSPTILHWFKLYLKINHHQFPINHSKSPLLSKEGIVYKINRNGQSRILINFNSVPLPGDQFCKICSLFSCFYFILTQKQAVFAVWIHRDCPKGHLTFFAIFWHKNKHNHQQVVFPYREVKSARGNTKTLTLFILDRWIVVDFWCFFAGWGSMSSCYHHDL